MTLEEFHALPRREVTPNHVELAAKRWTLPAEHLVQVERTRKPDPLFAVSILAYVEIVAVLLSGRTGDYCVYVGAGSTRWVGDFGTKLDFHWALVLFPGIESERYRP